MHPDDKTYVYEKIRRHFDRESPIEIGKHPVLCKSVPIN